MTAQHRILFSKHVSSHDHVGKHIGSHARGDVPTDLKGVRAWLWARQGAGFFRFEIRELETNRVVTTSGVFQVVASDAAEPSPPPFVPPPPPPTPGLALGRTERLRIRKLQISHDHPNGVTAGTWAIVGDYAPVPSITADVEKFVREHLLGYWGPGRYAASGVDAAGTETRDATYFDVESDAQGVPGYRGEAPRPGAPPLCVSLPPLSLHNTVTTPDGRLGIVTAITGTPATYYARLGDDSIISGPREYFAFGDQRTLAQKLEAGAPKPFAVGDRVRTVDRGPGTLREIRVNPNGFTHCVQLDGNNHTSFFKSEELKPLPAKLEAFEAKKLAEHKKDLAIEDAAAAAACASPHAPQHPLSKKESETFSIGPAIPSPPPLPEPGLAELVLRERERDRCPRCGGAAYVGLGARNELSGSSGLVCLAAEAQTLGRGWVSLDVQGMPGCQTLEEWIGEPTITKGKRRPTLRLTGGDPRKINAFFEAATETFYVADGHGFQVQHPVERVAIDEWKRGVRAAWKAAIK